MPISTRVGDITRQEDLEAVVNAANAELMPGGGVAGAIHSVAGPGLAEACRPLAPIEPGEAVITEAFDLPNEYVIHALGPRYGIDEPSDELLESAYRHVVALCRDRDISSVGIPAISAGAFGYPLDDAARIAVETVRREAPEELEAVFVLFDEDTEAVFRDALGD
ncbi:MAG: macro domain-containing protein [Wenzhouxiangellaceae bacterium]|nr:macro domain-containing protein [Wenzhouxiangellaceae bacterium]